MIEPTSFRILSDGKRIYVSGSVKGQPFTEYLDARHVLAAWHDLNEVVGRMCMETINKPEAQG